ncbi:amino acid adenylation domain-containing protein [Pseudomonas sp. SDO528_S397]
MNQRVDLSQTYPLTAAQHDIWLDQMTQGDSPLYTIGGHIEIKGHLDLARFRQAVDLLIQKHDALRTVLLADEHEGGSPMQELAAVLPVPLGGHDVRGHADPHAAAQAWMQQQIQIPFALYGGPLLRFHLLQLADASFYFVAHVHHLIQDGWGMSLMFDSLGELYSALEKGAQPALSAPSYAQFVHDDAHYRESPRYGRDQAYWLNKYREVPAPLFVARYRDQYPDRKAPSWEVVRRYRQALNVQIDALAQALRVSRVQVLLAALCVYFARTCGRDELVIGLPILNRSNAMFRNTLGLFTQVSAVRLACQGPLSFAELAQQIARTLKQDYRHQRYPLSEINRSLGLRRQGRAQLFDLGFSYEQVDRQFLYGAAPASVVKGSSHHEQTPLTLHLRTNPHDETAWLHFTYNQAYWQHAEVEAMAEGFMQVLEQGLADDRLALQDFVLPAPAEPAGEAPATGLYPAGNLAGSATLPVGERHRVLVDFNATAVQYPSGHTIHGLFQAQAARQPEAIALRQGDQQLSFHALNQRANQLAHCLLEHGLRPDDRVAICARRSLENLIGMLAVLKAGAAYVPIDPAYPPERIRYLLEDSAPVLILAQASTRTLVAHSELAVIELDSDHWHRHPTVNPDVADLTPANLAYVIYTSGSTGQPKGVMVEHRTLENLVHWNSAAFDLCAGRHASSVAGVGFDAVAWEVWPALCGGATLHLSPAQQDHENIDALLQWWVAQPLDVSFLPTPVAEYALSQGIEHPTLKTLLVGGDRLRHFSTPQRFQLVNNYGPAETTVAATSGLIEAGQPLHIGKPIGNTQVYVLDAQRQPVAQGVVGEVYVGGAGVARGYLNRPQMTAERFLKDPFSPDPQARLYRTGDLARWLEDGNLDFQGRNDDQVKIRGVRIELGEIETCLGKHPHIAQAVVLARDERLVAYFTEHQAVSLETLRDWLQAHLPGYLVPAAYVRLDSLPLTVNGKLDRKALPEPGPDALLRRAYEAPQGAVETALAQIWAEVLKVRQVGRHDNFFELGGHSLLAVNLIGRMRQVGLSADVRVLFGQPTLAALAAAVGGDHEVAVPANRISADCTRITPELLPLANLDQASIDRIVASVPGGTANVQDIYPLAPLQEGIFYHHLSAEQGDPYLLQARFSFADNSRLEAFAQALQAVIDRHDILRTSIVWEGLSTPMQVVWRTARLTVRAIELDAADGDVLSQLQTRFDARQVRLEVTQAPLMQLLYAQDPVNQRVVGVLLFHHLALDHVASKGLWQELQTRLAGNPHQLAASVPYRNYVAQARLGVSEQAHEAFFCEQLKDIDEPTLPFGLQEVQGDARGIEEATHTVGNALSLRLRAQAQRLGVSAASLFHQAWANVLATTSGQTTVVFGTVLLGRMRGGEGAERALGMYINTLPLRIEVGREDVRTGVRQTHARLTALLGHEHAPLALAQRCSGVAAPSPLFSALLNYRHGVLADAGEEAVHAWRGIELVGAQERTNYPLTLNVDDTGDNFSLTALVTTPIDAERVCGYMQVALDSVVTALETAPHTALQDLAVLPLAERQQVLRTWNTTDAFYPHDALVHQPFEAWARVQPDAVAVVYEDRHLTYGELNARANQLAHQLLALGVRPDDRVAVCVARGLDMIVGLLGILKSGAGYVPIDPASPAERIAYMLDDSTPMVLVTQTPLLDQLPVLDLPTLLLDASPDAGMAQHNPQPAGLTSRHLAYVIYTSGSTGLPKGVMVEHRNVARLFSATQPWFDFGPQDVWALFHSFAFDFSVWEIWGALTHGGRLLVVPQLISRSPPSCYALLCEAGVTVLNQTPSAFRQLIAAQGESDLKHRLRQVIFGGEALETGLLKPWYAREVNAHTQLVNMYGITETTVHVTYRALTAADAQHVGGSPIGGRIPDLQLYVLDARREPVPVGVTGELYVGGAGVARGYLNRPALTAERFLRNPFSSDPDARLYRTGDLGRWLADGSVEYLGRNDEQVKIRGFRIELGEIEARLAACDGVREAVVIAREDEPGDKRLVAYVIARENTELAVADLRRQLLLSLADYMVPSAFVQLDAWPLTTNGKLDRKRLPAPGQAAVVARDYVAPQTAQEQTLVAIWQDILNVPQVGLQDDFFELGGDSIRIITLISRVQKAFPASRVSIMAFYQAPTVQGLAAWLTQEADLPHEWLPELTRGAHDPELALVCVPYAGASAMVFQPLADQLRQRLPSARVYAVALPGNQMETRFDDSLDLMGIARACVERIGQRIAGPVSIYGHCAGSVLAMEIARQLEQQGREVRFVMLGGTFAPPGWIKYIPWNNPWRWHSDLALRRRMTAWGNTSAMGTLNEAELTGLLRSFRRDSGLALQHLKRQGLRQIVAPIVSVLSLDDPLTHGKEARYRVWGRYTQAVHGVLLADGGHYFVGSRAADVAEVVLDTHQHRDRLMSTPTTLRTWPGAER